MLPMAATLSKTGGRQENQDYCNFRHAGGCGCYLVADGLGGHRGGGLAARTAGEGLLAAFGAAPGVSPALLKGYLAQAREAILSRKGPAGVPLQLRTTLVVLVSDFKSALWAHIGDSRLYFFRGGSLNFQTSDHSVPQQLVKSGAISAAELRTHEDRNRLTAAFDGKDLERIKYAEEPVSLRRDDAFLLCSDGFWEYVYEQEMEEDLARAATPANWLDLMEKRLLTRAEEDCDNYSALAIICRESG